MIGAPKHIAVSVDGSDAARLALEWAAGLARALQVRLTVIHAAKAPGEAKHLGYYEEFCEGEKKITNEAVDHAREVHSELDVDGEFHEGRPVDVLIDASDRADLLVVGSRGMEGFKELLIGSVSQRVAEHARCAVAIVRPVQGNAA